MNKKQLVIEMATKICGRLKTDCKTCRSYPCNEIYNCKDLIEAGYGKVKTLEKEIESLKYENKMLAETNKGWAMKYEQSVKDFAEKLKEQAMCLLDEDTFIKIDTIIDNVLNEVEK